MAGHSTAAVWAFIECARPKFSVLTSTSQSAYRTCSGSSRPRASFVRLDAFFDDVRRDAGALHASFIAPICVSGVSATTANVAVTTR